MSRVLRVAIVGSGPAGMYAVEHLLKECSLDVRIDLYERLPVPWGLVRYGVAPDHPEKKLVIDRTFKYYLAHPAVRFLGNLEIGRDIGHAELSTWYQAVIYAVGAAEARRLGIPGEDLPGACTARDFVAWYNGHPDFSRLKFDLSGERAVVVGNGNVALDVARMLTMPPEDLAKTDIADYALRSLQSSRIREVVILGRSRCIQAAFHNAELEELGCLGNVDIAVDRDQLPTATELGSGAMEWKCVRKALTLTRMTNRDTRAGNKRIVFRFLASPVELRGRDRLERVIVSRNQQQSDEDGRPVTRPGGERYEIHTGILFRAVGYRAAPLPGLPFDEHRGVIENIEGRVCDQGRTISGAYVTGWAKNGPRGIIGTAKRCAYETVARLLADVRAGMPASSPISDDQILLELGARKRDIVGFSDWLDIDRAEIAAGAIRGCPRVKLTGWRDLLIAAGMCGA